METNINTKTSTEYVKYAKECINTFLNEKGRLPHKQEVNKDVSTDFLIQLFGSWKNALLELGFKKDTATIEDLKELRDRLGVVPSIKAIRDNGINLSELMKTYGSWEEVKNELKEGFVRTKPMVTRKKILSEEEKVELKATLTSDIISLTNELRSVPTIKLLKERHYPMAKIKECFGSWKKAVIELELEEIEKSLIEEELKLVQSSSTEKLKTEVLESSEISINRIRKLYGSWTNAYNQMGLLNSRKEAIQKEIVYLTNRLQKVPTLKDISSCNIPIKCLNEISSWKELKVEWELLNVSNKFIVDQIKEYAEKLDYTPTIQEMKDAKIKYNKLLKGGLKWNEVRENIGLPKHSKYSNSYINQLETALVELADEIGTTPSLKVAKENGIKTDILSRRHGGWNNVLFSVGLRQITKYTDEAIAELCNNILVLNNKLGRSPYLRELKEYNIPVNPLRRKYGSLEECYVAIGINPTHQTERTYKKEEVLNSIKELAVKNGKFPSNKAVKENGINTNRLIKDIGSWKQIKEMLMVEMTPIAEEEGIVATV